MAAPDGAADGEWNRRWRAVRAWVFTTDPVRAGVLWIAASMLFFFFGGLAALFMRTELAAPGRTIMGPEEYLGWFTLHGTFMIFFFAVVVFFGIGSAVVPRLIGANNMAFPRLNALDLWLILLGGSILELGFLFGQKPIAGWTSYPPLSLGGFSPGLGQDWWIWAVGLETFGATMAGGNFLATILRSRSPDVPLRSMPIPVWGILFSSVLVVIAGPFLLTALGFLWLDRNFGTWFFAPETLPGPLLWQDLFWFYSHPATYVMIIPAFGFLSAVLHRFSGRSVLSTFTVIMGMAGVALFGLLVWWHHMFTTGLSSAAGLFAVAMTWTVALPSGVVILSWIASLRWGRIHFTTPMLFALGFILMFTVGGANGVFLSFLPFDVYAHDTYWVIAHFHYIIFGGTVLGLFAAIYYYFPIAFGRRLSEPLGKWHFWLTVVGINLTFFPMHYLGLQGMPRRIHDYDAAWGGVNMAETVGAFITAVAQLLFLANLAVTLVRGRPGRDDPWEEAEADRGTATRPSPRTGTEEAA
ncbi:MAG: cbb3-type cytochrome c oxidase subunit I [Euryarchaeota archaeon]|nr:cbb3-type cytochrome c oxidase subunit I [Euryarchaeota archaeon]